MGGLQGSPQPARGRTVGGAQRGAHSGGRTVGPTGSVLASRRHTWLHGIHLCGALASRRENWPCMCFIRAGLMSDSLCTVVPFSWGRMGPIEAQATLHGAQQGRRCTTHRTRQGRQGISSVLEGGTGTHVEVARHCRVHLCQACVPSPCVKHVSGVFPKHSPLPPPLCGPFPAVHRPR